MAAIWSIGVQPASAQGDNRLFAGAIAGVSTLQADGRAVTTASDAAVSLYKPENGAAVNLFIGRHLKNYFSLQGNVLWSRNDLTLVSSTTANGGAFYEQQRRSSQIGADVDGLIYFRGLRSRLRPYLGTGFALLRFTSDTVVSSAAHRLAPPSGGIGSTFVGLRSHVGIDVRVSHRVDFRYSFSETISRNPISPSLTPPGERRLANFQNLFGLAWRF